MRSETSPSTAEADRRVRELGARFMAEKSTSSRFVYWAARHNLWILAKLARGGGVELSFHGQCPC